MQSWLAIQSERRVWELAGVAMAMLSLGVDGNLLGFAERLSSFFFLVRGHWIEPVNGAVVLGSVLAVAVMTAATMTAATLAYQTNEKLSRLNFVLLV